MESLLATLLYRDIIVFIVAAIMGRLEVEEKYEFHLSHVFH
jgi:hypothetical protein